MVTVTVTASNAGGSAETTFGVTVASGLLTSAVFTRVGTYTLPSTTRGFAGDETTLYYSYYTGVSSYVRGINPETGATTFQSHSASGVDELSESLAVHNGLAYVFDNTGNDFYTFNLSTGVDTRLNNTNFTAGNIDGLAVANGVIYAVSRSTDGLYTVNASTGQVTLIAVIPNKPSGHIVWGACRYWQCIVSYYS